MKSDLEKNIDLFFRNPEESPESHGKFSTLYLLRRDINTCFKPKPLAIWLGVMAILAGIDLLGKFLEGDDGFTNGRPKKRFKKFLELYFQLGKDDQEIIYQLRNALLHSFGLYSKDKQKKKYKFILTQKGKKLILHRDNDFYLINTQLLHQRFEKALDKYWQDLETSNRLKNNFNQMFNRYGIVYIEE